MESFMEALLSEKTEFIPEAYDWFAPLLGDWNFDYYDTFGDEQRKVKGEWLFRRVLNGAGIEDLFICPSRETMLTDPQPDGEYGAAVRMFNPEKKCYDMVYACRQHMKHLEFRKEEGRLVGTVVDNPTEKWVFSEITDKTFHWQNVTVLESGNWQINNNVYAKRKEK